MRTLQIPDNLSSQYKGAGWAMAAIDGGVVVKLIYLEDVSTSFVKMCGGEGFENRAAIFVKQAIQLPEIGPTVRELQVLGEVSVGMCSSWEFVEM